MSFENHLFVFMCVNQKESGKCCAMYDAEALYVYFRDEVKKKRSLMPPNQAIKIIKTSCLGQCALGPNIFISPLHIWYQCKTREDIDAIIESHLIKGVPVERLINREIVSGRKRDEARGK